MAPEDRLPLAKLRDLLEPVADFGLVFGSVLTDAFGPESDVDIAVYLDPFPPSAEKQLELRAQLAGLLNRDVDLVVLNDADLIITAQALANGRLIFARDQSRFNIYQARKMSEYGDFKLGRRWLENHLFPNSKG